MHYCYIPFEQVFKSENYEGVKELKAVYLGEVVSLTQNNEGSFSITRLFSTNPKSYLKEEFAPGSKVSSGEFKLI